MLYWARTVAGLFSRWKNIGNGFELGAPNDVLRGGDNALPGYGAVDVFGKRAFCSTLRSSIGATTHSTNYSIEEEKFSHGLVHEIVILHGESYFIKQLFLVYTI